MKRQAWLLLLLGSLLFITGCGQSGDLYLPEEDSENQEKNKN